MHYISLVIFSMNTPMKVRKMKMKAISKIFVIKKFTKLEHGLKLYVFLLCNIQILTVIWEFK